MKFVITVDGPLQEDELEMGLVRISELVAEGYTSGEFYPGQGRGWWEIDPPDDFDREVVLEALRERLKYCTRRVHHAVEPDTVARWTAACARLETVIRQVQG